MDKILAIIPVFNRRATTLEILARLSTLTRGDFALDVLVIDDGSTDGTGEVIRRDHPGTLVVEGTGDLWWGGGLNVGFRYALAQGYDFVYTLNDDIEPDLDALAALHRVARAAPRRVCGSVMVDGVESVLGAGYVRRGPFGKLHAPRNGRPLDIRSPEFIACDTISSQSTLLPISVLRDGIFVDEARFKHNYSDLHFFETARRGGYEVGVVPASVVRSSPSTSNYHRFLLKADPATIFASFGNVKYAHDLRTQWNIAADGVSPLIAPVRFVYFFSPYIVWLILKMILPKRFFVRALQKTNKIPNS